MILSGAFGLRALDQNATPSKEAVVSIRVDARATEGAWQPVWSFFGYDEPNYTYAENGKKLLGELRALSKAPVYIRVHNLLTSGDGSASLKWGSTNAYTEDALVRLVEQSRFGHGEIVRDGVAFDLRLRKS